MSEAALETRGHLLSEILAGLATARIRYCVLRNFESLPDAIDGDVDILIDKESLSSAIHEIRCIANVRNVAPIFFTQLGEHTQIRLYIPGAPPESAILALDIQTGMALRGIRYMQSDSLLSRLVLVNGVAVPIPPVAAASLILHGLIDKSAFKQGYVERILQARSTHGPAVIEALGDWVGHELAESLLSAFDDGRPERCLRHRSSVLHKLAGGAQTLGRLRYQIQLNADRLSRLIRPRGIFLVLLGPDGAGKSTIAESLGTALSSSPGRFRSLYLGSKTQTLPTGLKQTLGLAHAKQRGRLRDSLAVSYHCLRYLLKYWMTIYPEKVRGATIVGDRYFFDLFASNYYRIPSWLQRALLAIMPASDLAVLLSNDPEEIHRRKQEVSVERIRLQIESYRTLGSTLSDWHEVSTAGSVDAAVSEILSLIALRCRRACRAFEKY